MCFKRLDHITSITTLVLLASLSLVLGACDKETGAQDDSSLTHSHITHEVHKSAPLQLDLNGTTRWAANKETTEGVAKLSHIAEMAMHNKDLSAEDITKATKELEDAYQLIFTQCIMTGAAHDQLHDFLVPIKHMIAQIGESDISTAHTHLKALHTHLHIYPTYFE